MKITVNKIAQWMPWATPVLEDAKLSSRRQKKVDVTMHVGWGMVVTPHIQGDKQFTVAGHGRYGFLSMFNSGETRFRVSLDPSAYSELPPEAKNFLANSTTRPA